jgi:sec-independent protein translocase protein TatC
MPFFDHLEELRQRLFYCAGAIAVGAIVAFVLFTMVPGFHIIHFLARPIDPYLHGRPLVFTHPGDKFQLYLDAGFVVALIVASPVLLYQLWGFISPAMYEREKKVAIPVISGVIVLFLCGLTLAYTIILPLTCDFLLNVGSGDEGVALITISEYLGLEIYMCVAFGAAFEIPIVLMGLAAVGLVTPQFLTKYRRYAIVGGLIGGSLITPDPTAMFVIAIPLYGLYELGIFLARIAHRWRERREKGDDNGQPPTSSPPMSRGEPQRLDGQST